MKSNPDHWQRQFLERMDSFGKGRDRKGFSLSVKVRVTSGCYCRSCCPAAHRRIEDYRKAHPLDAKQAEYVEHESGPEVLLYLSIAAGSLTLAANSVSLVKSVIDLVTAIVNARAAGKKEGDKRTEPLEIIVRGFSEDTVFFEKPVLLADATKPPSAKEISDSLSEAIELIAKEQAEREAEDV